MSSSAGAARAPLARVSKKHPCLVCRHTDWCSYWPDGRGVICMRVRSNKPTRDGQGWMHFSGVADHAFTPTRCPTNNTIASSRADIARRHEVYSALLDTLLLSVEHRKDLLRRGLTDPKIEHLGYKSTPAENVARQIALTLSSQFDLRGVPGFYMRGRCWHLVRTDPGFFVQCCNESGRIEGMQIRQLPQLNEDRKYVWLSSKNRSSGTSSGAPVHFARPDLLADTEEVIITEGALKADVIAHLLNVPVIAASGVTTFGRDFAANLARSWPHVEPVIAFDADYRTNEAVRMALGRLIGELRDAGFEPRVKVWPAYLGKGFDDYLLASARGSEAA